MSFYVTATADRCEVPAEFVQKVVGWQAQQIRLMGEEERIGNVLTKIAFIATQYGGRSELSDHLIAECARLVVEKFGHFSLNDLTEAYRQWASEEIKIQGAEMWGGKFNVRQLGQVLAAYDQRRRRIVAELAAARHAWRQQQEDEARQRRLKAEFEKNFPQVIDRLKATAKSWEDVPEYIYHILRNRGMVKITKAEALQMLEEATQIAEIQIAEEKQQARHRFAIATRTEDRAAAIARKMTVHRLLCEQGFELPENFFEL